MSIRDHMETAGLQIAWSRIDALEAENRDLTAKLAEAQARAEGRRLALQGVVELAKEAFQHWDNDVDNKVGKLLLALAYPGERPNYDARATAVHQALAAAPGEGQKDFETWLRTVCFQKPTPEAYDLAKCAWNAAKVKGAK